MMIESTCIIRFTKNLFILIEIISNNTTRADDQHRRIAVSGTLPHTRQVSQESIPGRPRAKFSLLFEPPIP